MTDRELMQQALEALELEDMACRYEKDPTPEHIAKAITALRERLAQLEQWEPVWIQPNHLQKARQAPFLCRVEPKQRDDFVPLYTTPPQPNHIVDANKMVPQEPPPWWPAVENILNEYGLQAIDFVADFKNALAQPEQEPVALETVYETIIQWDEGGGKRSRRELARRIVDLYTAPPQRKPLLASDIVTMYDENPRSDSEMIAFARAIEAAHGIKGEA